MRGLVSLVLLLTSFVANATLIVIEPDDFAPGSVITSDYAQVLYYSNWEANDVRAKDQIPGGWDAPTGTTIMGGSTTIFRNREDVPWFGLTIKFWEPVTSVRLWALNYGYYRPLGLDCYVWAAGSSTRSGTCDGRQEMTALGESNIYELSFGGAEFDQITFGGITQIGAFMFDRVEAVTGVPEPATLALFMIGALGVAVSRRARL